MLSDVSQWGPLEIMGATAAALAIADSISQRIKAWLKKRDDWRQQQLQAAEDSKTIKALDAQTKTIKSDFALVSTKVDGIRQEIVEVREVNDERHRENVARLTAIEERQADGD
jgi:hypothetical protein